MCDWGMNIHHYGSFEWGLCAYHGNFLNAVGIYFSILDIVIKTWVACVSFVKTINLGLSKNVIHGWLGL
jgi:hypothetical protein